MLPGWSVGLGVGPGGDGAAVGGCSRVCEIPYSHVVGGVGRSSWLLSLEMQTKTQKYSAESA